MSNEEIFDRINEIKRTGNYNHEYYELIEECKTKRICVECGEVQESDFEMYLNTEGEHICETCFVDNYFICDDCGDTARIEDGIGVDNGDRCVCSNCERDYSECSYCGGLFSNTLDIDDRCICEDCINNGCVEIFDCESCGETHLSENILWDEDQAYCESCFGDRDVDASSYVLDYHAFENWQPKGTDELKYGFELEIENKHYRGYTNDVVKEIYNIMNADIVCEHDGSLNNGFEIISHPMDISYITKNEWRIRDMLNYLKRIGYVSHNPGTCGLHVHASRAGLGDTKEEQNRVINNLLMLFENFMEELIVFSRRKEPQIQRWSQFLSKYLGCSSDILGMKFIDKHKENTGRYMAINLCKYKTIEFRLFRGTLNFDTFMATIKLVDNFIKYAKKKSINGVTWNDLLSGDTRLKEYSERRGIVSTKKANEIIIKTEWTDKIDIDANIENEEEEICV